MKVRKIQCAGCPWRRDVVPARDIPNYNPEMHRALKNTIATPGSPNGIGETLRLMSCHEARDGGEYPCVGWVANQLGDGNNLPLRWVARDGRFEGIQTIGPQWDTFEETLSGEGNALEHSPEAPNGAS